MRNKSRWDIFCKAVDNFGDIGICWRLARQLHMEHGLQVRLWIDNLDSAQKIIPYLDISLNQQIYDEISILKWHEKADFSEAADIVIEAFACGLPETYLMVMAQQKSKWINLEYLSAEPWVADFHAKPSPQPQYKLTRNFYFPGFTEATGGLIRERNIVEQNQLLANDKQLQSEFWKSSNLISGDNLKVSLFCYPFAPMHDLLTAMASSNQAIDCYVPDSNILPQIASFFGKDVMSIGESLSCKNLNLHVLPFLTQADYDKLLSVCNINFVRGEDSWIRAVWAGKPFIWQPYLQTENTHMKKLDAFLELYYADSDAKEVVWKAHSAWSAGQMKNNIWQSYLDNFQTIKTFTLQRSNQLAKQKDLASKLVIFCNKL